MPGPTTVYRSRTADPSANHLLDRLRGSWDDGSPIPLDQLLPPDPHLSLIADLACQELDLRVAAGQPARAGEYLARFPALAVDDDLALYLLDAEILARKAHGPPPVPAEYAAAYPALMPKLAKLLGLAEQPPASPPGYELLGEIGRGGMGVIYRAKDLALKREVAVKVLQAKYPPTSDVARRFVEEAQITGQLQHPGIPAVHQVGTLADGRPFLAMKLIKGDTLADRLKRPEELNTLGVFEAICQAVGYAHERGVIHRDLKPQNVMVGAFGEVQVMDWGLAKVVGGKETRSADTTPGEVSTAIEDPRTPDRHEQTGVAGTPWYMAPEQAAGESEKIGPRTDVFALGGVLCAMLTGKPPLEGADAKAAAVNAVRGETAAAFARLDATVTEPELVALCKRCLAFDPEGRPADAGEVAKKVARLRTAAEDRARRAEVDRGKAEVEALAQRRRRRLVQWGSGLIAAVLLAGTSVSLWQMGRAMQAEERSNKDAQDAKRSAQVARDERDAKDVALKAEGLARRAEVAANADLWAGLETMTAEIVGDALGTQKVVSLEQKIFLSSVLPLYKKLAERKGNDETARARVARAALRVGLINYRLGRRADAAEALKQARDQLAKLVVDFPTVPQYRFDLAGTYTKRGLLHYDAGEWKAAEQEARQGVAMLEKLTNDIPDVPEYRSSLGHAHHQLGNVLARIGQDLAAVEEYRKGQAVYQKLVAISPDTRDYRFGLATTTIDLGGLLSDRRRWKEAEEEYLKALTMLEKLSDAVPRIPEYRASLAGGYNNLAILLDTTGRMRAAEEEYRKALALNEELAADFPSAPEYRAGLGNTQYNLGSALARKGDRTGAREAYHRGLSLFEKLAADFPNVPEYRFELATIRYNLGTLAAEQKEWGKAEEELRKAQVLLKRLADDHSGAIVYRVRLSSLHITLGKWLVYLGQRKVAEEEHRTALALLEKLVTDSPDELEYRMTLGRVSFALGIIVRDGGQPDESIKWFDKAIETWVSILKADPRSVPANQGLKYSHWERAEACGLAGKHSEAVKDWDRVIELSLEFEQPVFRAHRANSKLNAGRTAEAVAEVGELRKVPGWSADRLYDFARVYSVASDKIPEEKQNYADRAMEMLQKATKAGFKDVAKLKTDKHLDPLGERDDFKKLLADLEARNPAPPKK